MQIKKIAVAAFLALLTLINCSVQAQTAAPAPAGRIRVLILDGFSNHNWKLNTKLLRGLLGPTGLFDVSGSTCPFPPSPDWEKWKPDFGSADVIIQTCNDFGQQPPPKWPEPVKIAFVDFVKKGGGVLIFHSGNNAFPDWPEHNDIIALGWRPASYGTALQMDADANVTRIPPGQGKGTYHASRSEVLVHTLGEHPIHTGMPKTWLTPNLEVYSYSRGPAENVTILSYGQDTREKNYWPLEWTVSYGQGRVYASCFGHVWKDESETKQPLDMLAVDEQILIQRAIQWLAKRPVTVEVPKNFPTAEKVSLSENIELPKD